MSRDAGGRSRGRWRHAISWAVVFVAVSVVFVIALGPDSSIGERSSLATAYTSLVALLFTLTIGPMNVLRGRRNPLSTDMRRDAGLASAIMAVAHTGISLTNHFGGDFVSYFLTRRDFSITSIRRDAFGVGAWTGLIAVVVVVALALISSDTALRRIGRQRWKRFQRSSYVLAAVTTVHLAIFWDLSDRVLGVILVTAGSIFAAVGLQAGGAVRRRRTARAS